MTAQWKFLKNLDAFSKKSVRFSNIQNFSRISVISFDKILFFKKQSIETLFWYF